LAFIECLICVSVAHRLAFVFPECSRLTTDLAGAERLIFRCLNQGLDQFGAGVGVEAKTTEFLLDLLHPQRVGSPTASICSHKRQTSLNQPSSWVNPNSTQVMRERRTDRQTTFAKLNLKLSSHIYSLSTTAFRACIFLKLKLRTALMLECQERNTGTCWIRTHAPIEGHGDQGKEPTATA
jgi:hypothetical protein